MTHDPTPRTPGSPRADLPPEAGAPRRGRARLLAWALGGALLLGGGVALAQTPASDAVLRGLRAALQPAGLRVVFEEPVTVRLYAEDPAGGAAPLATETIEAPDELAGLLEGRDDVAWVQLEGARFSRTLELAELEAQAEASGRRGELRRFEGRFEGRPELGGGPRIRGRLGPAPEGGLPFGPRGGVTLRGGGGAFAFGDLPDGGRVVARFYAEDPAGGAEPVQELAYTSGEDDLAAFQEAFGEAAEGAAFVEVDVMGRQIDLNAPRRR